MCVCATCIRMNAVKDVNWCVEKLSNWCIETCSRRIKQALQPYFTTMITNSNDSFKKWFWIKILCNNVPWRMYFMHRYVCNLYFSLLRHHVKLHTNINSRSVRVKIFASHYFNEQTMFVINRELCWLERTETMFTIFGDFV